MTYRFISIDGEATLGTKCPTHKLEIKKMNEIEKTEGEIKVLQAKLELLKEMENHKSSAEKAYKRVYGCYPPTTPSVSNSEDERWSAFQKGYNASKEECKVEEEPKPKPETLYEALANLGYSDCSCDEIADAVEELFLPYELIYDGEFPDAYAYERGWNDAIKTIKRKMR